MVAAAHVAMPVHLAVLHCFESPPVVRASLLASVLAYSEMLFCHGQKTVPRDESAFAEADCAKGVLQVLLLAAVKDVRVVVADFGAQEAAQLCAPLLRTTV